MPQTLRKTFSYRTHNSFKPAIRQAFDMPLSLQAFLLQLQQYIETAKNDLLQPRQSSIDRILREAML